MKSQLDQLPPQALDLEQAILGAILIEQDAMHSVLSIISSEETFYKEAHQKIYRAILRLVHSHQPIDILTVTAQLKKDGNLDLVGGPFYIVSITQEVNSAAHIEHHCRIIQQMYIRRTIITNSRKLQEKAYDDQIDPLLLLAEAQDNLMNLVDGLASKKEESLLILIPKALDKIENAVDMGGITGIQTGFITLDKVTGGFQKSDLIILAARTGQGKTTFVINIGRNAAIDFNRKGAIFSLEMPADQLALKLIASEVERSTSQLTKGKIQSTEEMYDIRERARRLISENIIIDDTAELSLHQIKAKAHKFKAKYGIEWIIIDYLQLISAETKKERNREQEISSISRGLKILAKELNIPIIALSQLSRAVELRGGLKRPQLSDLRESGSIEQDADLVLFMLRYEYYGITQDEKGNSLENRCEIGIAKHRNGKVCMGDEALILGCNVKLSKFFDLEESL